MGVQRSLPPSSSGGPISVLFVLSAGTNNHTRDQEWGIGYGGGGHHSPKEYLLAKHELAPPAPPCEDIPDLAKHNALGNCSRRDSEEASWKPNAHSNRVLKGYGVLLILWSNGTVQVGWRAAS